MPTLKWEAKDDTDKDANDSGGMCIAVGLIGDGFTGVIAAMAAAS